MAGLWLWAVPLPVWQGIGAAVFDLDKAVSGSDDLKPLGEIKCLFKKFYRWTVDHPAERSHPPDVVLPDNYMYIEVGEKNTKMPWSGRRSSHRPYAQHVVKIENLPSIVEKSKEEGKWRRTFQACSGKMPKTQEKQRWVCSRVYRWKTTVHRWMLWKRIKKYDELFKAELKGLPSKLPQDVAFGIDADESKRQKWLVQRDEKKDFYLTMETMQVMKDMITGENHLHIW